MYVRHAPTNQSLAGSILQASAKLVPPTLKELHERKQHQTENIKLAGMHANLLDRLAVGPFAERFQDVEPAVARDAQWPDGVLRDGGKQRVELRELDVQV